MLTVLSIPLNHIKPNPQQPRQNFDAARLQELADSIRAHGGVEQPITVTPNGTGRSYFIVDGERRWRACRIAGLTHIDAIVEPKKSDLEMLESALIANLQRDDLNAIEEARAYQALIDQGLKVGDVAQRTGKAISQIYNRLQWLKLEPEIQDLIASRALPCDNRAATALLALPAGEVRVALAQKLARAQASLKAVLAACSKLSEQLRADAEDKTAPMRRRAVQRAGRTPAASATWTIENVRAAAAAMCAQCEVNHDVLKDQVAEPGWTLIAHAADQTCAHCDLRGIQNVCNNCPGVELLRQIVEMSKVKQTLEGKSHVRR